MAEIGPGPPRRLYENGFEGWDIQQSTYLTDYVLMIVCVVFAFASMDKLRGSNAPYLLWGLLCQFFFFVVLEAAGHGFGGVTHHLLDTYFEQSHRMGRVLGGEYSEWMLSLLLSVIFLPLAGACCAGTSFAFAEIGVGWIKLVKSVGAAAACCEAYLVLSSQADSAGTVGMLFNLVTALVACGIVFTKGSNQPGLLKMFAGNAIRVLGFAVVLMAPPSCRKVGLYRAGCPYAEEFNHNAVYHSCLIVSVVIIAWGVFEKYNRDRELAYSAMMRSWQKSDRMCGC